MDIIATRFQFRSDFNTQTPHPITFDRCLSPFYEGEKWAVRRGSSCMAKDGEWEYECLPSNRDDEFYSRCRFNSLEEAILAVKTYELESNF